MKRLSAESLFCWMEQGMPQTADLPRRFGGVQRLYGAPAAARIGGAHVLVVGLGGVGSWAAEALARSGLKHTAALTALADALVRRTY